MHLGQDERDLVDEAPGPCLARLERANYRMRGLTRVYARVFVGGVVAAADVSALEADPQVQPLRSNREAILTAGDRLRQLIDANLVEMCAIDHGSVSACESNARSSSSGM